MPESLRLRIARSLAGNDWPSPVTAPETTTTTGTAQPVTTEQDRFFPEMSSKRTAVYRDMEEIDGTMPEGSRALDVLADNAVNAERGSSRYFVVVYRPGAEVLKGTQKLIENLLQRTMLREKAYPIARETIKYGDNFLQVVVSGEERIERLMYMPPASMRRNEDEFGLLKTGREKGEWAYEQYEPDTTKFIAGFLPWQIEHLRWNRSGESRYGVPLLNAARPAWKKLQAMEEALVINWLTRAFARLCFELDVTGKSEKEAQVYIQQFMQHLSTRNLSATAKGISRLIVAKDIAIGKAFTIQGGRPEASLNNVKVLDTANSGLINTTPLEYWRNKFISATGVPKAHLGLEEDVNAKCLALDTKIPLLRGETLTLGEIIAEFERTGNAPWVLSWDQQTGRVVPGKVSWAGITRRQTQVLEVELDDGLPIRATPDHRFYDINGVEVEARYLTPGQQLMPLRMYVSEHKNYKGYVKVKDPHGKVVILHRRVAEIVWPEKMATRMNVHHRNKNKHDNEPDNLCLLSFHEHLAAHLADRFTTLTKFRAENGVWNKGITKRDDDERASHLRATTYIEKLCENPHCGKRFVVPLVLKDHRFCSKRCGAQTSAQRRSVKSRMAVSCGYCGKPFSATIYRVESGRGQFCSLLCRVAGIRERKRQEKTCEYCGEPFTVYRQHDYGRRFCSKGCSNTFQNKQRAGLVPVPNHRVRQVRYLPDVQDTGDITIEGWHNFFVADLSGGGVLVHNSTLEWQDARFVRSVQRIQSVMSECIGHVISLELALHGIEPKSVPFEIRWPSPAISDDLSRSQTLKNNADAAKVLNDMGLLDPEWLFTDVLGQTSQEYLDYSPQAAPKAPAAAGKAGGGDDK